MALLRTSHCSKNYNFNTHIKQQPYEIDTVIIPLMWVKYQKPRKFA